MLESPISLTHEIDILLEINLLLIVTEYHGGP